MKTVFAVIHIPCVKVYAQFIPDDTINSDGSIMTDEVSVTGVFLGTFSRRHCLTFRNYNK